MTIVFGKVGPNNVVTQSSAITVPWSQVKSMLYILQIHLLAQERLHGRVFVPKGILNRPTEPSDELRKSLPPGIAQKTYEDALQLFKQFSEENPEILEGLKHDST